MVDISTIATFDLAVGTIAGVLLLYLLYSEVMVVHYPRLFRPITVGLLVYAVTGPVVGRLAPELVHLIHGLATLSIAVGLALLVREAPRQGAGYAAILGVDDADADADPDFPSSGPDGLEFEDAE